MGNLRSGTMGGSRLALLFLLLACSAVGESIGRRASTTIDGVENFVLSEGSNRAGNDEEDDDLGDALDLATDLKTSGKAPGFDWKECKSEGGKKNCARCKEGQTNGALPCDEVSQNLASQCPDSKLWRGKYFVVVGIDAKAKCMDIATDAYSLDGTCRPSLHFPLVSSANAAQGTSNGVFTKVSVMKPARTSGDVGVIMLKRLVTHTCTGSLTASCTTGEEVADVFKTGFCVKCPKMQYNTTWSTCHGGKTDCKGKCGDSCSVFHSRASPDATDSEKAAFVKTCLPGAFDESGKIKESHRCNATKDELGESDDLLSNAAIMAF